MLPMSYSIINWLPFFARSLSFLLGA